MTGAGPMTGILPAQPDGAEARLAAAAMLLQRA